MKSSRSGAMLPIISFGGQNVGAGMRDRMTLLPCLSLPLLALSEPAEGGMTAPVTGVWLPFLRSLRPQACPPLLGRPTAMVGCMSISRGEGAGARGQPPTDSVEVRQPGQSSALYASPA